MAVSPPSRAQSAWMQPLVMPSTICFEHGRIVLGHGHVVEEEQRLGPAAEGVVDAHRHQIDADGVVPADRDGHLELRADAVGAGDQHRVFVVPGEELVGEIELEEAGEPIFEGDYAGRIGPRQQPRQPGHGLSVDFEIDAGILVCRFGHICCWFLAENWLIVAARTANGRDVSLGACRRFDGWRCVEGD